MPTEDASRYGSYSVQVKGEKELAAEKLMNLVINEVGSIREGLRSYQGKSSEYLNKEYRFKPEIDISISSQPKAMWTNIRSMASIPVSKAITPSIRTVMLRIRWNEIRKRHQISPPSVTIISVKALI